MKRMKMVEILAIVMIMATAIWVGAEAYGYSNHLNSSGHHVIINANLYISDVPPPVWNTTEELGIIKVYEYEYDNVTIYLEVKDREKADSLRELQPILQYNGTFYKVDPLETSYPVPPNLPQQPVGAAFCIMGWCATGILWLNWRKEDEATNRS